MKVGQQGIDHIKGVPRHDHQIGFSIMSDSPRFKRTADCGAAGNYFSARGAG